MALPAHKTKIVCTIGPASAAPDTLRRMLQAGMNVARLNFSHGDFAGHKAVIASLREAARATGRRLAILADLPGPKMRVGMLNPDPVELRRGDEFTLTPDDVPGGRERVSVSFARLPAVVRPGTILFLNDGIIQLEVARVEGNDVRCRVLAGGELRSRKGLNIPGVELGIDAFTGRDRECLQFALKNGVDAVSQSFVERAADVEAVRKAAAAMGRRPFLIAKIERAGALGRIDEILQAADGIMIARGDLGVETPLEGLAVVQQQLIRKANLAGKPVITATQMLESMVENPRPTRAEATDVANAVLTGTDCVMLSEESAMGKHPVEAVEMLAKISAATEPHRGRAPLPEVAAGANLVELISRSVRDTVERASPAAVVVPTVSGHTARMVARARLPVWIAAVSPEESTCQVLQFSYGVCPVHDPNCHGEWSQFVRRWVREQGLTERLAVLTEGPSRDHPQANHRLEIIDLGGPPA